MKSLTPLLIALGVVLSMASAALGQEQQEKAQAPELDHPAPGGEPSSAQEKVYLDPEGFRALFQGKTIHLSAKGKYYGSEYYKKGDRSVWVQVGRPCMPGVWYYRSPHFCFRYEETGTHCWTVFRRGENIFARSVDGFELRIDAVDEKPLSCAPELLS